MKQLKIKTLIQKAVILSILQFTTLQGVLFFAPDRAYALSTEYNNKIIQSSKSALIWEKKYDYSSQWEFLTKVRESSLSSITKFLFQISKVQLVHSEKTQRLFR